MPFFNVFFKTLGFLSAITIFIFFINILIYLADGDENNFQFTEGNRDSKNIIAVIDLNGPILSNIDNNLISGITNYINPERVKKTLTNLEKLSPKVVIFKLNSPGGTVSATYSLEKIINNYKIQNRTTIYFFTNEILASGGYWISTTGNKIYASYGSIIGSIGVSGPSWYYYDEPTLISKGILSPKIENKNEIQIFDQNAGDSKDLYNPFRKPTQIELDHLKSIVLDIYNDFLVKVSSSRKIEIDILKKEIGALIYNSKQAKKNYLIDDVLNFDDLIQEILIKKSFKDYKIISTKNDMNFTKKFFLNFFDYDKIICNRLNSNFVSVLPIFIKGC